MNELNFLPPKQLVLEKDRKFQNRLLLFSSCVLVAVVIISSTVWIYSAVLEQKINDLTGQKTKLSFQLESNSEKIQRLDNIHRKANGIKQIFAMQFNYAKVLADFFQIIPDGIGLKSIAINSNGEIHSGLTASGSAALKNFLAVVTRPENNYQNVQLGGITLTGQSSFEVGLDFKTDLSK